MPAQAHPEDLAFLAGPPPPHSCKFYPISVIIKYTFICHWSRRVYHLPLLGIIPQKVKYKIKRLLIPLPQIYLVLRHQCHLKLNVNAPKIHSSEKNPNQLLVS